MAAGNKLLEDKGKEAAQVVVRAVLLKIKEKVGTEAVDVVGEYLTELGEVDQDTLLARINAATDEDVATIILDLAAEVVELAADDAPLVIALDSAELLAEGDRRLLADVAPRLPDGLLIRVGFGTYTEAQQAQVEDLLAVGDAIQELPVPRLSVTAIREWLEDAGQDPQLADEVYSQTGGYPLDVGDAVAQLSARHELGEVEPSQQFRMRTRQAWRALDPGTQAVARQLAIFEQPLPARVLQQACGLSAAQWGAAVERLNRGRIFSTVVNGAPWFHPRRRQAILDILGEDEREELAAAARRAIDAEMDYLKEIAAPELTADIATFARLSMTTLDDETRTAAELDRQQLAVAAATIDIFEPNSHPPRASHVLQHARDFFDGQQGLIPALEALVMSGLVAWEGDEQFGGFLRPNFQTDTARAVMQGRALQELGRIPLPGLVSSVFELALAPRLAPFINGIYGSGVGTMREFVETAEVLARDRNAPIMGRGRGYFLNIRARFHGRPSATMRFATVEDRAAARAGTEGLQLQVFGDTLEVYDVVCHSHEAVAAERFVGAIERVLGTRLRSGSSVKLEMETPYDPDTFMRLRVDALKLLAERCDDLERRVFALEEVPSIHWHFDEAHNILVQGEVFGGEPRSVRHDHAPPINQGDGLTFFRYAEAFDLGEGERLSA